MQIETDHDKSQKMKTTRENKKKKQAFKLPLNKTKKMKARRSHCILGRMYCKCHMNFPKMQWLL